MILDAVIIFLIILIVVLEVRRGMVKAFADMLGAVFGLKCVFWWQSGFSKFLKNSIHLSDKTSFLVGDVLIFLIVIAIFFVVGILVYNNFPLGLADVFEQIFCIGFSMFTGIMIMRFIILMIVAFGTPAMQNYITTGSYVAQELYTLKLYGELVNWLMPLTHPGEMYI